VNDDQRSIVQRLTDAATAKGLDWTEDLTDEEARSVWHDWSLWARPSQMPPDTDWRIWLILAGRGFGKTRSGAEWVRGQVEQGCAGRIALVGATAADVRDTMIEGESGLLKVFHEERRPRYEPSKRRITFHNGAIATTYSADEPDRLRGPNHDLAWADEIAAWRYPEAWAQLMFGLRIGDRPRVVATTTPKPTRLIRELVERNDVAVTRGSTYDNAANLSPAFLDEMRQQYEGTRLGRQELNAEILLDADGALWTRDMLDDARTTSVPPLKRIVVAVDPAVTSNADSDETGIVVAGIDSQGRGYVLEDRSLKASPSEWAAAAVTGYHVHKADRIVAEANQGGDMISHTIRTVDASVPVKLVRASRGKRTRAEPVAALYEQGRVAHAGLFPELEDQLCTWTPDGPSPDRLDALVWALTELMVTNRQAEAVVPFQSTRQSPWAV
jgi:phage terminase large subunit-like protein